MQQARNGAYLQIGALARELDLNPKTIRYYEEIGLLPPAGRTAGGYRAYGEADRERLRFIGKAKAIGLSLAEVGEVLRLRQDGQQPCGHVLELLDHKLALVDQQLRALQEFRRELLAMRQEAAEAAVDDACVCGIIEQHEPVHLDERTRRVIATPLQPPHAS